MSILQDLDPQYAKIYQPEASRGKKIALWIAGMLLVGIWGAWIAFTLQTDSKLTPTFQAVKADALAAAASLSPARTVQENPPQAIPPTREETPPATPASAIIHDERNVAAKTQALQPETSENDTNSNKTAAAATPPATKPMQTAKATETKATPLAKKAARTTPKQIAKATTQDKAKKEKPPVVTSKKATERDVDIISAIVR